MERSSLIKSFISLFTLVFIFQLPLTGKELKAQETSYPLENRLNYVEYNNLILKSVPKSIVEKTVSTVSDLNIEPLSMIEENIARNLDSNWAWRENTLNMIDSYSPFLFRTKKSANQEEVKIIIQVNAKGKLSGFEVIGEVDKGLKERIDFVLRKLPDCKPVPGYASYAAETFELIIKK